MTKKSQRRWLEAYQKGTTIPEDYLIKFLDLYEGIKWDKMNQYLNSKAYQANDETNIAFISLNDFRNRFIHFMPSGWSIEVNGLPILCLRILSVISFLVFESGNIGFKDDEAELCKRIIESIKDN